MTRIKKVTQSIPSSGLVLNEYADSETDTYSTAYLNDQLDGKQDTLTAGTGITIDEDNVISSEGREYTAGTGLVLDDTEFSIDTTVVAEKSDLPTVNNATLTLQKNGSTVATFTANSATDTTANISVPTKTSDLTNDGASGTGTYAESSAVTTVANNLANETNAREQADNTLTGSVNTINGKIPAQASTSNQLADKAFVNSSVQTATANFRGNWDDWADVPTDASLYPADYAGSTTPTVNDYMVLQDASDFPVGTGEDPLEGTWRFKYSGTWATDGKNGWHPEYQVNETPLTAAQLAALNSGITSTAVTQIGTNTSDISSLQTSTNTEFGKVAYIDDTVGTTTNIAYVATSNIQDGAVTESKLGSDVFPIKLTGTTPFTAQTGFEITNCYAHKQGTHYWGDFMLHKTSGNFTGSDETVAKLSVTPDGAFGFNCMASASQWVTSFAPGHAYITNYSGAVGGPALLIGAPNTNSWARIHFDFVAVS